jgi:3-oxoacyl-[acyl-carrier protein] reductase
VWAVRADVTDPAEVAGLLAATHRHLGPVDILVNNAGRAWSGDFVSEDYGSMAEVVDVNVKGVLYMTRAVLPDMMGHGDGVIVNVSSGAGLRGIPGIATYSATKFAVVGFTEALSQEVGRHGIRVYGICPGRVATDMQEAYSGRRIGAAPSAIAEQIVALAGRRPPIGTGKCLVPSGRGGR